MEILTTKPTSTNEDKIETTSSENEKTETTTSRLKTTEYSLYSSSITKFIDLAEFSTIPEAKVEKNSIRESTDYIPTTTSSIANTEYTLTSSYGDNKEKIETTIVKHNPILTTSFNNPKTSIIGTKIPTYINLTSNTSIDNNIPTTIIENKIQTTIINDNVTANVILIDFSSFSKYTTYCTFYIHFLSISGSIFSSSLTIKVEFIYNRSLRFLQSHEAICKKVDDNLEKVSYLCNIEADVSNVVRIKIEKEFKFESQEINIIGISPFAQDLLENIKKAEGKYNNLLGSNI